MVDDLVLTGLNPKGQTDGRFKRNQSEFWWAILINGPEMKPKTVLIKNETHYERIPSPETMRLELNYIYDFGHLGGKNYKCKYAYNNINWDSAAGLRNSDTLIDLERLLVSINLLTFWLHWYLINGMWVNNFNLGCNDFI